jgi:hypothetical protein
MDDGPCVDAVTDLFFPFKNGIITNKGGNVWESSCGKNFNAEIDDILVSTTPIDTIPIYNHYNIQYVTVAEVVPQLDLSGIWQRYNSDNGDNNSYMYLGKDTSDYMIIGDESDSGSYYLSSSYYFDVVIHFIPKEGAPREYLVTISKDLKHLYFDGELYTKVKDI